MTVERIGVSLEGPLLVDFDRLVKEKGYPSRSEALRDLIRQGLVRQRWESGGKVVGSIRATAHTHLNEETCLEVLIVDGEAEQVAKLGDRLRTVKGVLFAETVVARPDLR